MDESFLSSTSEIADLLLAVFRQHDPGASRITAHYLPGSAELTKELLEAIDPRSSLLLAALASASRAARAEGVRSIDKTDFDWVKRAVDGAATSAGEKVLNSSTARIVVRAGEGARDKSPGAVLDQTFGHGLTSMHAVLDYVDGTGLVAAGLPNALSLGALSRKVERAPDLKAFAVFGPRQVVSQLDAWQSPEETATSAFHGLQHLRGCSANDLTVLTHSRDVGRPQDEWYDFLRARVGELIVPDPIAVEPPFVLSTMLPLGPRVDLLVGVMGLVELLYAAVLLDLGGSDYCFRFRVVSSTSAKDLAGDCPRAFDLCPTDSRIVREAGLDQGLVYSSEDFLGPGSSEVAGMFAVTENTMLKMGAASAAETHGIVALPRGVFMRLDVHYEQTGATWQS